MYSSHNFPPLHRSHTHEHRCTIHSNVSTRPPSLLCLSLPISFSDTQTHRCAIQSNISTSSILHRSLLASSFSEPFLAPAALSACLPDACAVAQSSKHTQGSAPSSAIPSSHIPPPPFFCCLLFFPLTPHSLHSPPPTLAPLSCCFSPNTPAHSILPPNPCHCFSTSASFRSLDWGAMSVPAPLPEGSGPLIPCSLVLLFWLVLCGMGTSSQNPASPEMPTPRGVSQRW